MNLLFKPIAIILSIFAGRLARTVFTKVWTRLGPESAPNDAPPQAKQEAAPAGAVVAGAALQAAVAAGTAAGIERVGRRTFANLTGIWPGEKAGHNGNGSTPA